MKWIKDNFIKFIKWLMNIKSIKTMSFMVFVIFFAGYYSCKKDINLKTLLALYNDFIEVKIVESQPVKQDSIIVITQDSIKVITNE